MKFKVERTSVYGNGEKPCEGVKLENYDYIERRTYTEEEFNRKFAQSEGLWRSKGINHTNYERGIKRTFTNAKNGWFIELNTISFAFESRFRLEKDNQYSRKMDTKKMH